MVLIIPKLVRKGFNGITLYPFIILAHKALKEDERLIRHEKIHLRQQIETLILPFYIWYILEYLYHWIKLKNPYEAYRAIRFEKEAYENQNDPEYLKNRKPWAFLNY